jgi:hypothetical protein
LDVPPLKVWLAIRYTVVVVAMDNLVGFNGCETVDVKAAVIRGRDTRGSDSNPLPPACVGRVFAVRLNPLLNKVPVTPVKS